MHAIKKLLRIVFALAGLLALAAYALTIFGPWTSQALSLFRMSWYSYLVQALTAIAVIGLIVTLIGGIAMRKDDTIVAGTLDGGQLIISREAIASQAAHIVEADGTCTAQAVDVSSKRRGRVRVGVKVLPHSSIDVVSKGQLLHEQLVRDLSTLCGNNLDSVSLEFLQPETATDLAIEHLAPASYGYADAPSGYSGAEETVLVPAAEPTVVASATAENPALIIEPTAVTSEAAPSEEA